MPNTQSPKKGDQEDKRCAFVTTRVGKHDLGPRPSASWCYGCDFYVCDDCTLDEEGGLMGDHDVTEHLISGADVDE